MKALGISLIAALALAPFGCGGGDDGNSDSDDSNDVVVPDARPDGPAVDAPPDSPVLPAGCDYAELNDTGNDGSMDGGGQLEETSLGTTATLRICGKLNNGHYVAPVAPATVGKIDLDMYHITISADANIVFSLSGTGLQAAAGTDGDIEAILYQIDGQDSVFTAGGTLHASHIANAQHVVAGDYYIVIGSFGAADATAAVDYKAAITVEATRPCTIGTGAADYTEANDGANNDGNDVVTVTIPASADDPTTYALTASATDAAEPTTPLTIGQMPAGKKISGTSGATDTLTTDSYFDYDSYQFTTGANVDQVRMNLSYATSTPGADLDVNFYELPLGTDVHPIDSSGAGGRNTNEYGVYPVKPSTTYMVQVGGFRNSATSTATADGFPKAYDVQLCGETFVAP